MIFNTLRLASRLPLPAAALRVWSVAAGRAVKPFRRARDLSRETYAAPPPGALRSLFTALPDVAARREWILPLAERYKAHRFDLLGSGWTDAAAGANEPVNPANRRRAAQIRALIDPAYAPIDWNGDFKSGFRWSPRDWYGDIRVAPVPGADIKAPWELARMQHLATLAHAYALTRDEVWAREIRNQILDFIASNPPRFGVNWRCAMDVAIRAANWIVAADLICTAGYSFDPPFNDVFKASLIDHGCHVMGNLERYPEGRANHYLADIAGLAFIAAALPHGPESESWLTFAARELSAEILRQFNPDGSNFEASVCYHRLSAEMAAWAVAALVRAGASIPDLPLLAGRLAKAGEFLRDLTKPGGRMVQIGDNDNGRFFKFEPVLDGSGMRELSLDGRATVAALASLTGRTDLAKLAGPWLDGELMAALANGALSGRDVQDGARSVRISAAPTEGPPLSRTVEIAVPNGNLRDGMQASAYPDFGVWIFRSRRLYLAVRCGPTGRDGRGAHAHNDQLAIELAIDGEDWIADPGSYLYTPDPAARNAYRSVTAHAAPQWPDGREPADLGLALFWLDPTPGTRCLFFDDARFVGEHTGFSRPVRREVWVSGDAVVIRDYGLPGPVSHIRAESREQARAAFPQGVPFSPGYGQRMS